MSFQIEALPAEPFAHYFDMSDDELAALGACRMFADEENAFPCRVSLRDANIGEELILCNYEHLPVDSPYRARHAVFVSKGAETRQLAQGDLPEHLAHRLLSLRGFTKGGMLRTADVSEGDDLRAGLSAILEDADIDFVDIHNARQGCFHARARRV
ncbi:MAG: DUF1203 domain-containing protein [Pseudomonadota bacterium]